MIYCSDGENTANCVTLKPSCHVTYNKTEWKMKTGKKSPDEVLLFYKYPVFKIIDFEVARNESTSILLLTKIKETRRTEPAFLHHGNLTFLPLTSCSYWLNYHLKFFLFFTRELNFHYLLILFLKILGLRVA